MTTTTVLKKITNRIVPAALMLAIFVTPSWAQIPKVKHVVVVLEENTPYENVCGPVATGMPSLCALKPQGGFSANYFGVTHPSIGNYTALGWGVVTTNNDGCVPTTCGFPYTGDNIVREVEAAGKSWKGYAESLPSPCYFGGNSSSYAARHTPIPYISDVQTNCTNRFVAFEDSSLGFAHDLASNTLPDYSFVTPNLCDDAHDCGLPGSPIPDQWLNTNILQPLLSGHLDPKTGDTVLIVTFDEGEGASGALNVGGQVFWFIIGANVKQGYQSTGPVATPGFYSHYSTLRLTAELVGANPSGLGNAGSAPEMAEFFVSVGVQPNPPIAKITLVAEKPT